MDDDPHDGETELTPLTIVLFVEAVAAMIALATTITPSKTGSTWTFAHLFWDEPTFFQKLLIAFAATNVLLAIIGLVGFLFIKFRGEDPLEHS